MSAFSLPALLRLSPLLLNDGPLKVTVTFWRDVGVNWYYVSPGVNWYFNHHCNSALGSRQDAAWSLRASKRERERESSIRSLALRKCSIAAGLGCLPWSLELEVTWEWGSERPHPQHPGRQGEGNGGVRRPFHRHRDRARRAAADGSGS